MIFLRSQTGCLETNQRFQGILGLGFLLGNNPMKPRKRKSQHSSPSDHDSEPEDPGNASEQSGTVIIIINV
jgi:hypothetical protein